MFWFINTGGPLMWVLVVIAVALVVLIVKKALQLFGNEVSGADLEKGLHAILFWGAFSAVLGVYAQLSGIYRALRTIIDAPEISPPVIAEGMTISFHTTLFGLSVFLIAGLAWFILYRRYRALSTGSA
jgi:biopolymer transport protein ExbB/TolQ